MPKRDLRRLGSFDQKPVGGGYPKQPSSSMWSVYIDRELTSYIYITSSMLRTREAITCASSVLDNPES